jgi:UDP-galactopyranose mutase
MNRFTTFKKYEHTKFTVFDSVFRHFPLSIQTFQEFYPDITVEEIERRKMHADASSFTNYLISIVGEPIFDTFYRYYTLKQWGTLDIPVDIAKRIPIRTNTNTNYFHDTFQALPDNYNLMFQRMVAGVDIQQGDYNTDSYTINSCCASIVYTGAIDEMYGYDIGPLDYRTLDHQETAFDMNYYQPCATLNFCSPFPSYTRSIEHKHFGGHSLDKRTIVTYEYSRPWKLGDIPYYPMWDFDRYNVYRKRAEESGVILAGRLGLYKYLDMNVAVKLGLKTARELCGVSA